MGDVINVHFKRKREAYKNYVSIRDLEELLNDEKKENARLRAEISRLKWRLKGEE